MNSSCRDFHDTLIDADGVDHATGFSVVGQQRRFDVLLKRCARAGIGSVLDYGCNVGDLLDYAVKQGFNFKYTGVDSHEQFIARLHSRFPAKSVTAVHGCITNAQTFSLLLNSAPYDHVFASGAFCYADQQFQHPEMLRRLWNLTGRCMAVNFLSDLVSMERRSKKPLHCFYHPNYAHVIAERLRCRDYAVYHDYMENDFTLALYRDF